MNLQVEEEIRLLARTNKDLAFDTLYRRVFKRVFFRCNAFVQNPLDAADMAQNVFLNAWGEPRLFTEDFRMVPWLLRVADNMCRNLTRHQKLKNKKKQFLTTPFEFSGTPLDHLIKQEKVALLNKAQHSLQCDSQKLLYMKYMQELPEKEIASRLGIPNGTVFSRLNRARSVLKDRITKLED